MLFVFSPKEEDFIIFTCKSIWYKNIGIYSLFLEKLNEINFPDYSKFETVNDAYSDFVGKVTSVIDQIAPMKEIRVKNNSPDWFDAEIHEEIETRDKLFAKFKKSKKSNDHKNYKKARNKVQHLINKKKKTFVVGKLN